MRKTVNADAGHGESQKDQVSNVMIPTSRAVVDRQRANGRVSHR